MSSHQDVAVPFMLNVCWEEDTLFMIFEEDFRFEPEQEDVEPIFVPASEFQEVLNNPGAGAAPRPATSKLHAVSLLLSNRFFERIFESGSGVEEYMHPCFVFIVLKPTANSKMLARLPLRDVRIFC